MEKEKCSRLSISVVNDDSRPLSFVHFFLTSVPYTALMEPAMNPDAFMSALERDILAHPFLAAPFVKRLSTPGAVLRRHAARFALLYYPHIYRTRLYQANALGT